MRVNKYEISKFICPECNGVFPLPRQKSCRREKGHIKDLWCPFCKKKVKTLEIRALDVFETLDKRIMY